MTRENKLALVVGFGLILFVGILISDHFSIVHKQEAANFVQAATEDPLRTAHADNPGLIELQPLGPPPPAATTSTMAVDPAANPQAEPGPTQSDVRPLIASSQEAIPDGFVRAPSEADPIPVTVQTHRVRGGESLFGICREHYGDTSLVKALAKFNSIEDPAAIEVGQPIKLPAPELLGGRKAKAAPSPASDPAPPVRIVKETPTAVAANSTTTTTKQPTSSKTYTVKSGDSLAAIAKRVYGSRDKWRKLYDMNRHVLDDPDTVKPGTILNVL